MQCAYVSREHSLDYAHFACCVHIAVCSRVCIEQSATIEYTFNTHEKRIRLPASMSSFFIRNPYASNYGIKLPTNIRKNENGISDTKRSGPCSYKWPFVQNRQKKWMKGKWVMRRYVWGCMKVMYLDHIDWAVSYLSPLCYEKLIYQYF